MNWIKIFVNTNPVARLVIKIVLLVLIAIVLIVGLVKFGQLFFVSLILLGLVFLVLSVKQADKYETVVVLRLGKQHDVKEGGGLYLLVPILDKAIIIDMRVQTIDPPRQEMITSDNVTISVDAVMRFRVVDAEKAVFEVTDYPTATRQAAVSALRSVVGECALRDFLSRPEFIRKRIKDTLAPQTEPWGIAVIDVGITEVELPESMKGAFGRKAEVRDDRRGQRRGLRARRGVASTGHERKGESEMDDRLRVHGEFSLAPRPDKRRARVRYTAR